MITMSYIQLTMALKDHICMVPRGPTGYEENFQLAMILKDHPSMIAVPRPQGQLQLIAENQPSMVQGDHQEAPREAIFYVEGDTILGDTILASDTIF